MTTKKKPGTNAGGKKAALPAPALDRERADALAKVAVLPSANAALVMTSYGGSLGLRDDALLSLVNKLADDTKDMQAGDMKRAEAMLFGQAHALQSIFVTLAQRAASNIGQYIGATETYLRLALKAQGQCRATLETLATIKNPPVVIARQANINNGGQQQVNNGAAPSAGQTPAHAAKATPAPSGLLEQQHGQWLDSGAPSAAGRVDPHLATVGEVNRSADR